MAVNDEIAHFSRAYEISNGVLVTKKLDNGNLGGYVPHAFTDMDGLNFENNSLKPKPNPTFLKAGMDKLKDVSINQVDKVEIAYSNSALYSPITYAPQAIAVLISRMFDLSFFTSFIFTRFVVLALFIAIVAAAIRIAPTKKWAFLAIALLPMCIQQASSVSGDALIIAFSLLFVASFLYIYKNKTFILKLNKRSLSLLPILLIAVTYVSLAKPVYFPLFLSLLFLPKELYLSKLHRLRVLLIILGIPFLLLVTWNGIAASQGNAEAQRLSVATVGIYPPDTKEGIKSLLNPAYTAELLFHTYIDQQNNKQEVPDFIVQGFFGKFTAFYITPPAWYMLTVGFALLLGLFMVDKAMAISRRVKLVTLLGLVIACIGITFSMFFITTTAGQDFINGVQGRYFIPLVVFTLFFITNSKTLIAVKNGIKTKTILLGLIIFNLAFMEFSVLQWFHF